jgi:hypothetical protein
MAVANKTFSTIKFFVKNAETTAAFTQNEFFGDEGSPAPFPNASFTNTTPVNLPTLSANYEIKFPVYLGTASVNVSNYTVTSDASPTNFINAQVGDYILYNNGSGTGDFRVLGKIATIAGDDESVTLTKYPPLTGATVPIYLFSKDANYSAFSAASNFYMVIKNADYTTANQDGVLNIDSTVNSAVSSVFAYGPSNTINPTYFSIRRISKTNIADESQIDSTLVSCSIIPLTKYANGQFPIDGVLEDQIPYWTVYEINPYGSTSTNLNKNTIYRIDVPSNSLPSKKIDIDTGGGGPIE